MKNLKENNGITLVATVIAIIVIIILAAITLNFAFGNNGLIKRAQQASQYYRNDIEYTDMSIANVESYISEITKEVEQVTDENPGVLEGAGTDDAPYTINSIEDLVFFAYDVTNGNNYEGKYVSLGLSLDFNSNKSYVEPLRTDYGKYGYDGELKTLLTTGEGFKPIGSIYSSTEENFYGTFDGSNKIISNLYINMTINNEEGAKVGFIANNKGNIYNLTLSNVDLYLNSNVGMLGGICGQNYLTGNIDNCMVSGNITNESFEPGGGGIASYSSGNIQNCANIANINVMANTSSNTTAGGICSNVGSSTKIEKCFNKGKIEISNSGDGYAYAGGILAFITDGAELKNCYNMGTVVGNTKKLSVGGITGKNWTIISNCYSTGEVMGTATEILRKGMLIGSNLGNISNIYYLKNNEITGIGTDNIGVDAEMAKTESFMKSKEFIDILNQNGEGIWKEDVNNINNGYPILDWQ